MKAYCRTARSLVLSIIVVVTVSTQAQADLTFGEPTNLGSVVNSSSLDGSPNISVDGLEMYFYSDRPGGYGDYDLWLATRSSVSEEWSSPVNLGPSINSSVEDCFPCLSPDGLTMYFSDYYYTPVRPGGRGEGDLWMCTRSGLSDPWSTPVNVGPSLNTSSFDVTPTMSGDGLILVFVSNRPGGLGSADLWMATRPTTQDDWDPATLLGPNVNTAYFDGEPALASDGLTLFFMSNRGGGFGDWDLWMTTRKTRDDPWGQAVNLGPAVNTSANESTPFVSPDMRTLYFGSTRPGSLGDLDIWSVPILPVVDFTGDGKVNVEDLLRLIESWGRDDPAVDIGPTPWGDGTVDAADLDVLMRHWGQEVDDPTLVAHWTLDETEGVTACDSSGVNDGIVIGLPQWRPQGGTVDGALELNGTTFITANTPLSPADGVFTVLVWVKGGAPGQTIVSQAGGTDWLTADTTLGALMTGLSKGGRTASKLLSQAVITDGNWHRIGFTWDGASRRLCVDDVLAAEDTQGSLAGCQGKLVIGAASNMARGTFWSGLIDDVRIYSRVVQPAAR